MILAGDIGGTNSRLALFELAGADLRPLWRRQFPSQGLGWSELLSRVRAELGDARVSAASFAVAGPVGDGRARVTNLGWEVSAAELAHALALPSAGLLNDLEASAHGLCALGAADFALLQAGSGEARGNQVLCSPGTGLGEAALVWDGRRHRPLASEGGHSSFSPMDELELELWRFLHERHGHVSWERVLSGPGLVALYEFLRDAQVLTETPELARELARGAGAAAITRAALAGTSALAERTLELFARLLGAEASNLALKFLARGGVFLGGGIAPRIVPFLERPAFLQSFLDKGRMRGLLEELPVRVVLNPDSALLGAARHAALATGLLGEP